MSIDKYLMFYIHIYGIIDNSFIALKYFLCFPMNSLYQPLAITDLFTDSIVLPFPEYNWNYTLCCCMRLASFIYE